MIEKKAKEVTAVAFLGGPEFSKKTSGLSFANPEDYALCLHVHHAGSAAYQQALAVTMALSPDLEAKLEAAIEQAYRPPSKQVAAKAA